MCCLLNTAKRERDKTVTTKTTLPQQKDVRCAIAVSCIVCMAKFTIYDAIRMVHSALPVYGILITIDNPFPFLYDHKM